MAYAHYTDEQIIEALKGVKGGKHPSDVAKELGVSDSSVFDWVKRAGLTYEKRYRNQRDWAKILKAAGLSVPNEVQ